MIPCAGPPADVGDTPGVIATHDPHERPARALRRWGCLRLGPGDPPG